jgi:hypothetical protein
MSKRHVTIFGCDRCGKEITCISDNVQVIGWEEISVPYKGYVNDGWVSREVIEYDTKTVCSECAAEHFALLTEWFERRKNSEEGKNGE